ncbi:hypothetical protein AC578_5163 [Pseudocercospora eumusae]|uniref:Uncharacterized protein n=1 Tax=Pseudocercospora eumusae TaxID=321146 RepID=A0A139HMT6_9PEZI|nr:hypothetical protein AC578_5163 [Pseudocercospora eumusae]
MGREACECQWLQRIRCAHEIWLVSSNRRRAILSIMLMICQQMTSTNASRMSFPEQIFHLLESSTHGFWVERNTKIGIQAPRTAYTMDVLLAANSFNSDRSGHPNDEIPDSVISLPAHASNMWTSTYQSQWFAVVKLVIGILSHAGAISVTYKNPIGTDKKTKNTAATCAPKSLFGKLLAMSRAVIQPDMPAPEITKSFRQPKRSTV